MHTLRKLPTAAPRRAKTTISTTSMRLHSERFDAAGQPMPRDGVRGRVVLLGYTGTSTNGALRHDLWRHTMEVIVRKQRSGRGTLRRRREHILAAARAAVPHRLACGTGLDIVCWCHSRVPAAFDCGKGGKQ